MFSKQIKTKAIHLLSIILTIIILSSISNAAINKNYVETAVDEMAYQGFKAQGLSVADNFEVTWDTTITVNPGALWTYPNQSPDVDTRKSISTTFKSDSYLRAFLIRVNQDCWLKLQGNGINAKYAGVDSTKLSVIRAGESMVLGLPNVTNIIFYGNGTAQTTVDIRLFGSRAREVSPLN